MFALTFRLDAPLEPTTAGHFATGPDDREVQFDDIQPMPRQFQRSVDTSGNHVKSFDEARNSGGALCLIFFLVQY